MNKIVSIPINAEISTIMEENKKAICIARDPRFSSDFDKLQNIEEVTTVRVKITQFKLVC